MATFTGDPCVTCGDNPGTMMSNDRWYCSQGCKDSDLQASAPSCDPINELPINERIFQEAQRAGAMVQSLFDLFVEKTWAVPTVSARMIRNQDGSILAMPVTLASDNDVKQVRPGGGWLAPMVLDVHKPWDVPLRSALVADRNSIWAFIVAYAAVKVMFRRQVNDVSKDIKEVIHTPKPSLVRLVKYYNEDHKPTERRDQPYPDTEGIGVFEITLKSGEKVALQLTSKQFAGHDLPHESNSVMRWHEYWDNYADKMTERVPLGTTIGSHWLLMQGCKYLSHLTIIGNVHAAFCIQICRYAAGADWLCSPVALLVKVADQSSRIQEEWLCAASDSLDNIIGKIDSESERGTDMQAAYPVPKTGLLHPNRTASSIYKHHGRHMIMTDYNPHITNFRWEIVKDLARDPGLSYAERKEVRDLLACKAVYAPWGDHRLVFDPLDRRIHSLPQGRIKENPYWDPSRKMG